MKHTNILVALDTRVQKKDGTYPVVLRVSHNRETTSITTGVNILEKDWDSKNRSIRKSYADSSSVTRLNNVIQKKKTEALDTIVKLDEAGQLLQLSIKDLRGKLVHQKSSQSFFSFAEAVIADLLKANRIGTARSYKGLLSVVKTFNNGKDLSFSEISYGFLSKFETYHKGNGNGVNGLAVYMRTIRAIYNRAINEGVVDRNLYPFINYKIKTAPTQKRALEWDLLQKIITLSLEPEHPCFHARNYFVASYMLYGINFTDMAFLLKTDMQSGRIVYRRKKTNKIYDIKITPNLEKILTFYIEQNPDSKYIFPILKRDTAFLQEKDIRWARKRYNDKLKDIAALCSIEKNLTSYVSRHSFATQAMLQQVPLNAISSMLGHSSLKTTEVYLKSLPSNVLDEYNQLILHAV